MPSALHCGKSLSPPLLKGAAASFLRLLSDEQGQAVTEYALVATAFGVLMFVFLAAIRTGTGTNLNSTQSGLTGLYNGSPAP